MLSQPPLFEASRSWLQSPSEDRGHSPPESFLPFLQKRQMWVGESPAHRPHPVLCGAGSVWAQTWVVNTFDFLRKGRL